MTGVLVCAEFILYETTATNSPLLAARGRANAYGEQDRKKLAG